MKKISIFLVLLLLLFATSCNNNSDIDMQKDDSSIDEENKESDNESSENKAKFAFVNEQVTVGIGEEIEIAFDTDIPNFNIDQVTYKIVNGKCISFQKNGNLKSSASGEAQLIASYGDYQTTMNITITTEIKSFEKTDYRYWLNLLKKTEDVDKELMSKSEIDDFNKAVYSDYSKTKVYDLTTLPLSVQGDYVKGLINTYTNMSKYNVYKTNNVALTQSEKNEILSNRNLDNIGENVMASYGVIVTFTSMRSYPTSYYADTTDFDRFQETGLAVGEGVLIYHTSKDKEWVYVQAENYHGWIKKNDVATCNETEFLQFYRNNHYMVITGERLDIDGTILRMGDKLPYKEVSDKVFIVYLPKKCGDETVCISEVKVEKSENVHDGYLPYTYTNLYYLGFKLLNTPYRWGDINVDGRDCSSTQNAIYHCFGFVMPRNTSNQSIIPGYSTKVNGLDNTSMKTYKIGTLIYTSSHVMMYIGMDENGTCYLLHNSSYCKLQTLTDYCAKVSKPMIATLTIR